MSGKSTGEQITLTLAPRPGIDASQALRGALKVLLRRFGLRCVRLDFGEVQDVTKTQVHKAVQE